MMDLFVFLPEGTKAAGAVVVGWCGGGGGGLGVGGVVVAVVFLVTEFLQKCLASHSQKADGPSCGRAKKAAFIMPMVG
jgi:uncharacterized membrane protein